MEKSGKKVEREGKKKMVGKMKSEFKNKKKSMKRNEGTRVVVVVDECYAKGQWTSRL
jgi:hypothetical protein